MDSKSALENDPLNVLRCYRCGALLDPDVGAVMGGLPLDQEGTIRPGPLGSVIRCADRIVIVFCADHAPKERPAS